MSDPLRSYQYLERFSVERLEELLDSAVNAEEETDDDYIDALLKAIVKKEAETPHGRLTDPEKAWADFQTYYNTEDGRGQTLFYSETPDASEQPRVKRKFRKSVLIAVAVMIGLLFCIAFAQASGFQPFLAVANWTDHGFSFSNVQSSSINITFEKTETDGSAAAIRASETLPFDSFQEALDAYSISEVKAPTWLPEGYALYQIQGLPARDPSAISTDSFLDAAYINDDSKLLLISLLPHHDRPAAQIEKTDDPVEVYDVNDTTFYLMKNTNNYAAVWLTEHYQCIITSPFSIEKEELLDIITNMLEN